MSEADLKCPSIGHLFTACCCVLVSAKQNHIPCMLQDIYEYVCMHMCISLYYTFYMMYTDTVYITYVYIYISIYWFMYYISFCIISYMCGQLYTYVYIYAHYILILYIYTMHTFIYTSIYIWSDNVRHTQVMTTSGSRASCSAPSCNRQLCLWFLRSQRLRCLEMQNIRAIAEIQMASVQFLRKIQRLKPKKNQSWSAIPTCTNSNSTWWRIKRQPKCVLLFQMHIQATYTYSMYERIQGDE